MDYNKNNRNDRNPNRKKRNRTNIAICIMAAMFAIGLIFFLNSEIQRNTEKEISYTKFIEKRTGKKSYVQIQHDLY